MIYRVDVEQGTEEWFRARSGIPTASRFSDVMAQGAGKLRRNYLYTLAAERAFGVRSSISISNKHMEFGTACEPKAREMYEFLRDVEVTQTGLFILRDGDCVAGASPDGMVGDDGLIEIKTKLPHLLMEIHDRDEIPPEYIAQVQGQLWVTDRKWTDFVAYYPEAPVFIKRVERDEDYIAKMRAEVTRFCLDIDAMCKRFEEKCQTKRSGA